MPNFLTNLRDRFLVQPVADKVLKAVTPKSTGDVPNVFAVPLGFNNAMSNFNKRMVNSIDFMTLRTLSVRHETTRAAINARKRQITQLGFDVVDTSEDVDPDETKKQRKLALREITNIGGPGVRFRELLDKLIEDVLVLDTACFYKQRTRGGDLIRIVPIDGATIKLRLGQAGDRPMPPEFAFEQWIRGSKVAEMTTDEITYEMMNPRTDSPYGLSPIESLILSLDASMRALLYNLNYLSDSNVPQGFLSMPEGWDVQQIKEYKEWFDSMVSNSKAQVKVYPIPNGTTYQATSKPTDFAFGDFFDYLDKKVCMMFDIMPQELGLTLRQYKENAEGQERIQIRKGVRPMANFIQEIFTDILQDELGFNDFQFKFTGLAGRFTSDEVKTFLPIGVLGVDEVRGDLGLRKLGIENVFITGAAITPVSQLVQQTTISGGQNEEEDESPDIPSGEASAQEQAKKTPPLIPSNPQGGMVDQRNMASIKVEKAVTPPPRQNKVLKELYSHANYRKFYRDTKKALLAQLRPFTKGSTIGKILEATKADMPAGMNDTLDDYMVSFDVPIDKYLKWAAEEGGQYVYDTLKVGGAFSISNPKFVTLLGDRKNYLITSVDDTTKQYIADAIQQGLGVGLSQDEIAQQLEDGMDDVTSARADMIVRTELANAVSTSQLDTYKDQGVEKKEWVTAGDSPCDICIANEDAGAIPIDDEFDSGDDTTPGHPNAVLEGNTFASYGELKEMVTAEYDGEAIEIETSENHKITVGVNHPMFTQRGMIKARQLTVDDYLIYDMRVNNSSPFGINNDFKKIPMVEDAFNAFVFRGSKPSIASPSHDLHGDKIFCKGEIQVIKPTDGLLFKLDTCGIEKLREGNFMGADMQSSLLTSNSTSSFDFNTIDLSSSGFMSGSLSSYKFVHICSIHYVKVKCKAFDTTTETGLYNSNGFIVSNCECFVQGVMGDEI